MPKGTPGSPNVPPPRAEFDRLPLSRLTAKVAGVFHRLHTLDPATGRPWGALHFSRRGARFDPAAGWTLNWESLHVFCSWKGEEAAGRVAAEEDNFARLWEDRAKHAITFDVPEATRADRLRFLPENDKPARFAEDETGSTRASSRRPGSPAGPGVRPGRADGPAPAGLGMHPASREGDRWRRAGEGDHRERRPLAAPGPRLPVTLFPPAPTAAHRRRGRSRQQRPGRSADASGVAGGPGETDAPPGPGQRRPAVADGGGSFRPSFPRRGH